MVPYLVSSVTQLDSICAAMQPAKPDLMVLLICFRTFHRLGPLGVEQCCCIQLDLSCMAQGCCV